MDWRVSISTCILSVAILWLIPIALCNIRLPIRKLCRVNRSCWNGSPVPILGSLVACTAIGIAAALMPRESTPTFCRVLVDVTMFLWIFTDPAASLGWLVEFFESW